MLSLPCFELCYCDACLVYLIVPNEMIYASLWSCSANYDTAVLYCHFVSALPLVLVLHAEFSCVNVLILFPVWLCPLEYSFFIPDGYLIFADSELSHTAASVLLTFENVCPLNLPVVFCSLILGSFSAPPYCFHLSVPLSGRFCLDRVLVLTQHHCDWICPLLLVYSSC